ncbi:phage portal protein [Amycolatopsis tolypomycina]|uniref:phage portal protein n=1 Tax=Amycolatopsis tolypomycina TaxID=208445 RepID=UPI0033B6F31C
MGFIRSAFASSGLGQPERWLLNFFGGEDTAAGVRVTPETAMTYSAFYAAVRVITEDVSSCPLPVFERQEKGKRLAVEHPLYGVLNQVANPLMTAVTLRKLLQAYALTWGNGVAVLGGNGAGDVTGLYPLRPDRLYIEVEEYEPGLPTVLYRYTTGSGKALVYFPDEVLHIAGLGFDGIRGYSVVHQARTSIGLGLATERFGANWFGNGSRPAGVLTHPGAVSEGARERMRTDWQNMHKGLDNAHKMAILEEGVTWQSIGIPPEDAQFLETRQFGVEEMARWFRLPPHKLAQLLRATFSNIEHQGIDYVNSSLRSWLVEWEQQIMFRCLTAAERARYFVEHNTDQLTKGDFKTQMEGWAVGRNWGIWNADEIREKVGDNPLPDGKGQAYLVPLNMVPAVSPEEAEAAAAKPAPELPAPPPADDEGQGEDDPNDPARSRGLRGRGVEARRRMAKAFSPLLVDADRRLAKLEQAEVRKLVRKHLDLDRAERAGSISTFLAAVWELLTGTVRAKTAERLEPILQQLAAEVVTDAAADVAYTGTVDLSRFVTAYTASHVDYRVNSEYGQIRAAVERDPEEPQAEVEKVLDRWVTERPEQTARWESNQLSNAAARETWRTAGVARVTWVTNGDTCPFCTALDGRTVDIDTPFVAAGAEVGLGKQLQVERKTFHPPLHPECDCNIVNS